MTYNLGLPVRQREARLSHSCLLRTEKENLLFTAVCQTLKLEVICLQDALKRGIMSAAELRQWLALAAKPVLGALSRRATH